MKKILEKEHFEMSLMRGKFLLIALALLAATFLVSSAAFGQSDTQFATQDSHSFTVGYYINANQVTPGFPDAQVHIANPGNTGAYGGTGTTISGGDLCANIYIFTADEQLSECCSCKVSPNGMLGLGVVGSLANNPFTGVLPHSGAIKIVASFGGGQRGAGLPPAPTVQSGTPAACDPGSNYQPFGELESWITHVRPLGAAFGAAYDVTETDLMPAGLSRSELQKLQQMCYAFEANPSSGGLGSGQGVCNCGTSF